MKHALLLSLAFSLSAPAFAEKKSPAEYWNETGLSTEVIQGMGLLSNQNCLPSAQRLKGCLAAINAVGARAKDPLQIIPAVLASDPLFGAAMPFRVLGNFYLVRPVKQAAAEKSVTAVWASENSRRQKLNSILEEMISSGQAAKLDFSAIFNTMLNLAQVDAKDNGLVSSEIINAYLSTAMDAHAHIDSAEQTQESLNDANVNFVGIGANIQSLNGNAVIPSTIEGSPAQKAGIQANDIVLSVDGVSTAGLAIDDVVSKIRGIEGTVAKLKILRKGRELEIPIVRGKIVVENVASSIREDFGAKVGVIRLKNFMDNKACEKIEASLKRFEAEKVHSLVLDLRSNGGGLLDQAVCIGGLFLGKQVIVKVKSLEDDKFTDLSAKNDAVTKLPMAVLIDSGSASASEVLAGALQDNGRAWIVGERSFGKATVQAPAPFLGSDRILYFRTIQRFYQPSGRTNQVVGIEPDLEVAVKPDATAEERFALREGELFPNALTALGEPWKQKRPDEVKKIEACIASGSLAKGEYSSATAASAAADYQLLMAEETLRCAP